MMRICTQHTIYEAKFIPRRTIIWKTANKLPKQKYSANACKTNEINWCLLLLPSICYKFCFRIWCYLSNFSQHLHSLGRVVISR